jgi:hypothetical protein
MSGQLWIGFYRVHCQYVFLDFRSAQVCLSPSRRSEKLTIDSGTHRRRSPLGVSQHFIKISVPVILVVRRGIKGLHLPSMFTRIYSRSFFRSQNSSPSLIAALKMPSLSYITIIASLACAVFTSAAPAPAAEPEPVAAGAAGIYRRTQSDSCPTLTNLINQITVPCNSLSTLPFICFHELR